MSSRLRSTLRSDWQRNGMRSGLVAVTLFRVSQSTPRVVSSLVRAVLIYLFDLDIPARTQVGPGLSLGHGGRGVVVHPDAVIGANVWLHHRVTLAQDEHGGYPRLGDGCVIGTGAVVMGPVTIGEGAAVAPNALVREDVPRGAVAAGNPARVVAQRRLRNA